VLEARLPARGGGSGASAGSRAALLASSGWLVVALPISVVLAAPIALLASVILTPTPAIWRHLWETRLPGMLVSTAVLVVSVALGALVLGAGLAWLVTAYRFPGRRLMGWLLALPLAMPAYVLGFLFLSTMDHAGPVQTLLRARFGGDVWFPEVRSLPWAALILSLALYPYVFLLARAAFREQSPYVLDAARATGQGPVRAFLRVALPMARPSLAAGTALVMMETLTDFATVRLFNVQTIADGVFRVWFGLADRSAATELAGVLLVVALVLILLERRLRGRARYHQQGGSGRGPTPIRLSGWRAALATAVCSAVLLGALGLPVARLAMWSVEALRRNLVATPAGGFVEHATHSLTLASAASLACLVLAVVLANAVRFHGGRSTRAAVRLATSGYAVPGAVVAVGVVLVVTAVDRTALAILEGWPLITGTLLGLVYAYVVRYIAVTYHSVEASLVKITPTMTWSARTLGATPAGVLRRVHLPMMRAGALMGSALVFLDVMKELPATLLLRPFDYDTLAVWVWRMTSESRWVEAAVPSLAIVLTSLVPLLVLLRYFERGEPTGL
jgi:iron(III) transport system permease protein